MKKIAATKDLQDEPPSHAEEVLSNAQVITWSCVLTWEASFITLGNLFTIITFTFIKKLRPKKSLYLVINMAFADLLLGSVSTYIYFYPCNLRTVIAGKISRFSENDYCCFRAGLFYFCCFDICWEILRHLLAAEAPNTFCASVQACYFDGVVIGYPWFFFYFFLLKFFSIVDLYFLLCLYGLSIVLTICGLNIGIWIKFRQKTVPHHQNRALQNRRLTKTLLFASLIASGSWIPTIVYNLIVFLGYKITNKIFLVTFFIFSFQLLSQSSGVCTTDSRV